MRGESIPFSIEGAAFSFVDLPTASSSEDVLDVEGPASPGFGRILWRRV